MLPEFIQPQGRPVVTQTLLLAVIYVALIARITRTSVLEVLNADYVRTARAKGLSGSRVLLRYALPNAITPVVTQIGLDFGYFLGGVVVVEQVFAWPGIGFQAWQAIDNLDVPMIMGTVLFSALLIVVANLIVDLLYAYLDPRIRLGAQR